MTSEIKNLKDNLANTFWKIYIKSDELERRKQLLQLTGINELNVSLMQSYFDDLIHYIKKGEKSQC